MNGEDVFGSKIRVIYSSQMDFSMQGQMRGGNVSQSHIPVQPLVSVAPMMLPGTTSCTSAWKPTWTQVPTTSMAELSLAEKLSEPVKLSGSSVSQNGSSYGSSVSNSKGSSREHSPPSLSGSNTLATVQRANSSASATFWAWSGADQSTLKREVAALLQDVPNHSLPLFTFREMFEKRYRRNVSSSDLYKLKGVVTITENKNSCLVPTVASTFSSLNRTITLDPDWTTKMQDGLGVYCSIHQPAYGGKNRLGWAEREIGTSLPSVVVDFRVLSHSVHALLESHNGGFPLISFLDCYEANYEPLERAMEGTPSSVHLEHLIACVQGVEIALGDNNLKRVQWCEKRDVEPSFNLGSNVQLAQLSRELADLLKTFPKCSLPFSKIIPAYHHHYGRQCRVADYGHTSLSSLLLTLPNTIQVMGEGQNRVITLAHRAQMKRFATDVLRVLKAQPGLRKQIRLEDFPSAFSQLFPTRTFSPEDYGLCFFPDLISELVENSSLVILTSDEDGGTLLSIPKREQTPAEIHRTRMFAVEVIELLGHAIRLELPFSKFIPAYHHHFGRQCRVSDYGFGKLAELFEAIGDTVVLDPPNGNPDCSPEDKVLHLAPREHIKVVGDQIWKLVDKRNKSGHSTRLNDLDELYMTDHGFALRPELCGAKDVEDLIEGCLSSYVQLEGDRIVLLGRPLQSIQADHSSLLPQLQPAPEARGRFRSNSRRYSTSSKVIKPIGPPTISQEVVSHSPVPPSPMYPGFQEASWMLDNGTTSSPPVSPPVIWAYHPVCYPNPYSPGTPTNVLMPSFSYSQWSPPPGQSMSQVHLF